MTAIKGVGRRYANIVLKKADIDLDKRAGECSEEEVKSFYYNSKSASFRRIYEETFCGMNWIIHQKDLFINIRRS